MLLRNAPNLKVMVISGIFHLMFLDHHWPQVTETVEGETMDKGGLLY